MLTPTFPLHGHEMFFDEQCLRVSPEPVSAQIVPKAHVLGTDSATLLDKLPTGGRDVIQLARGLQSASVHAESVSPKSSRRHIVQGVLDTVHAGTDSANLPDDLPIAACRVMTLSIYSDYMSKGNRYTELI